MTTTTIVVVALAVAVTAGVLVWIVTSRRTSSVQAEAPAAAVSPSVRATLVSADATLGALDARREIVFEDLKAKYGGAAKDPNLWVRHMEEMLEQVTAVVPDDPWPDLRAAFDEIADAFLAAGAAERHAMSSALWEFASLQDGHLGYVHHVAKSLAGAPDANALRRAIAVAAMGRGGRDYRDTSQTLAELVSSARAAGLDANAEFARVAELAAPDGSWGGSGQSPRDALRSVCR